MEYMLLGISSQLATVVHVVLSFLAWLSFVVFTAGVLVLNRTSETMARVLHEDYEDCTAREDDHRK